MNAFSISGGTICTPFEEIRNGTVLIKDGTIQYVGKRKAFSQWGYSKIDATGKLIFPGLIDLQVNGGGGVLYNDATSPDEFEAISRANASTGTTSILATVISAAPKNLIEIFKRIADFKKTKYSGAQVVGIHLEGPYLNPARRGGHAAEYLFEPNLDHFKSIEASSQGNLKIVSLSPELPGVLDLISYIKKRGIRCSLAHTKATYDDVSRAVSHGLDMATHLYNAMEQLGSREPGTVGAVLSNDNISTGLICDGKHVHPMSLRVAIKAKGIDKVFAVTDAVSPLGTSLTSFKLYGVDVVIRDGGCYTPEGVLAGSATPLLKGVKNLVELVGLPMKDAVRMATINPAREIGIAKNKGSLEIGKDADILVCNPDYSVDKVFVRGQRVV